jgi:hypothetical protein
MQVRTSMLRATSLVAVAALALHELRYLIGFGGRTPEALSSQGHGYLPVAVALAGALLVVAAAQLTGRVLRARLQGGGEERAPRLRVAWLWASVALLAIFVAQESLEGLLSSGHPEGLAAITANGGLVAIPLAAVLGGLVALGLRGAGRVLAAAARRARASLPRPRARLRRPRSEPARPLAGVLALNLAGRAPPSRL